MCTKFDLVGSLLLIKRAGIQNYPIFRITPSYLTVCCMCTYDLITSPLRRQEVRVKRRKCMLLLSYNGKGYLGMQM